MFMVTVMLFARLAKRLGQLASKWDVSSAHGYVRHLPRYPIPTPAQVEEWERKRDGKPTSKLTVK